MVCSTSRKPMALVPSSVSSILPAVRACRSRIADRRSPLLFSARSSRARSVTSTPRSLAIRRRTLFTVTALMRANLTCSVPVFSAELFLLSAYQSLTMRMTGCLVERTSSAMAGTPPRSSRPLMLSASSRIMSLSLPSLEERYSPVSLNVSPMAPRSATDLMASAFRWSEAFISTTSHLKSAARARAALVLPVPGVPISTAAFFAGLPLSHDSAQSRRSCTALGLPNTSSRPQGRYASVQSSLMAGRKTG